MAQSIQALDNNGQFMNAAISKIVSVMHRLRSTHFIPHHSAFIFSQHPQQQCISRLWTFKPGNKKIVCELYPQVAGETLKFGNQRLLLDFLRVISYQNSINKNWRIAISDANDIILKTTFSPQYVAQSFIGFLPKFREEAKNIISQLLGLLVPYSLQALLPNKTQPKQHPISDSPLEQICLLFATFQTKKEILKDQSMKNYYRGGIEEKKRKQELLKQLQIQRECALKKILDSIKILGQEQCFKYDLSRQKATRAELNLQLWAQKSKRYWKHQSKNVFAVKISQQTAYEQNADGNHCQVLKGKFQLTIMTSFNNSTNQSLPKAGNGDEKKELQLAKKICKNPLKQESINSFKNELDFIYFIREKNCKYIATYYWNTEINKADMNQIIMDYYPHTLNTINCSKKHLASLKSKLILLLQIANGLSWLADNKICHRDIKPLNIMLDYNRIPKIVDYGSCCPVFQKGVSNSFKVSETKLLTTPQFSLRYSKLPQTIKKKYDAICYEQHILFDAYSFGKVMEVMLPTQSIKGLKAGSYLLSHLQKLCVEELPQDRPTYQQIGYMLHLLICQLERQYESS